MTDISVDLNTVGMKEVLADLRFPAPRWEIIAHAQDWGASHSFLAELIELPARPYDSLRGVSRALQAQRDTSKKPDPPSADVRRPAKQISTRALS